MSVSALARRLALVATGATLALPAPAPAAHPPDGWLRVGDALQAFRLAPGNFPEGIAAGPHGVIYIGNRRDDGQHYVSEILAIGRDGSASTLAVLAELPRDGDPGNDGVLGLATGRRGDIYAALVSPDPALHGVWRLTRDGARRVRLPGSERMIFPNALAFDARERLYVTDSLGGTVWRFPRSGSGGAPWARHDLLAPAADDPYGGPLPGANGIAFLRDRLYVANTEKGLIARVPIARDGSAGVPSLVAAGPGLATADGLAADARGGLHAVIPGHAALGISPLVQVDPASGSVAPGLDPGEWAEFDVPLSLMFGAGRNRTHIFATNGDLPGIPPEARLPGVVEVNAGVPGA
jgi:hypothetical protein